MSSAVTTTRRKGRTSRLTASQIAQARAVHADLTRMRRMRVALCNEWDISIEIFNEVGRGESGKNPRPEA